MWWKKLQECIEGFARLVWRFDKDMSVGRLELQLIIARNVAMESKRLAREAGELQRHEDRARAWERLNFDAPFACKTNKDRSWICKTRQSSVANESDGLFRDLKEVSSVSGMFIEKIDGTFGKVKSFKEMMASFFAFGDQGVDRWRDKAPRRLFVQDIRKQDQFFHAVLPGICQIVRSNQLRSS